MKSWSLLALVVVLTLGALGVAVSRFLGRSGSRPSLLVSVVAQWLAAYVLWNFAGGLALHYRFLTVYDGTLFGLVALGMGWWQYRTRVRLGPEPALAILVGGQLAWALVVGVQNGLLRR